MVKQFLRGLTLLVSIGLVPASAQIGSSCPRECYDSGGYANSSGTIPTCVIVLFFHGPSAPGSRPLGDPCSTCEPCRIDWELWYSAENCYPAQHCLDVRLPGGSW